MYKPTLFIFCGLPGSGKTTLAKQLELKHRAVRLCPDEWMAALDVDMFNEPFRNQLERALWGHAEALLRSGHDVILENGLWSKQERDEKLVRAKQLGVRAEMHFFKVSLAELKRRLALRNKNGGFGVCPITTEQIEGYWKIFQPPTRDELATFDSHVVH